MKKTVGLALFFFAIIVVALSACGNEESNSSEALDITLTMGEQSGSMYPIGAAIGEYIGNTFEGTRRSVVVGGALANLELVGRNEAQMGHSSSGLSYAAFEGIEPFDNQLEDVTTIAKVFESLFHIGVIASAEIDSFEDVKEKQYPLTISVGNRGTENELLTRRALEEYGITYDDLEEWGGRVEFVSMGDASSLIRDGHIEAVTSLAGYPAAPFEEIMSSRDLKFLSLSEEVAEALSEKYGYQAMDIPANTYNNQAEAVNTVGGGVVIIANKNMPEEIIYEVTKWMNSEAGNNTLGNINAGVNDFLSDPEKASEGLGAPLHPGAQRYYEEVGVAVD
ncbi:TAXI family TRAP transporter solute-binding subunit [Halalkalibacter oceani]|uniref:TAXI family TRAP transporter solute-binding subunit n=1 Tax=Halalkalibacter oceani TaxID=1653776 RepID=UPI003394D2C3